MKCKILILASFVFCYGQSIGQEPPTAQIETTPEHLRLHANELKEYRDQLPKRERTKLIQDTAKDINKDPNASNLLKDYVNHHPEQEIPQELSIGDLERLRTTTQQVTEDKFKPIGITPDGLKQNQSQAF